VVEDLNVRKQLVYVAKRCILAVQECAIHCKWILWIGFAVVNVKILKAFVIRISKAITQPSIGNLSLGFSTINSSTID